MEFLTNQFIAERYRDYAKNEPTRRGTPAGQPIGFSKNKYLAMLYVMLGMKLKDVAKRQSISYQVVRRWNTEEQFKKAIKKHSYQFAEYLLGHLQKEMQDDLKTLGDLMEAPIKRLTEYKPLPEFPEDLVKEYRWYHPYLKNALSDVLSAAANRTLKSKKPEDLLFKRILFRLFNHMTRIGTGRSKETEEIIKARDEILGWLKKEQMDGIRKILLKKLIMDRDRREAMLYLIMLEF